MLGISSGLGGGGEYQTEAEWSLSKGSVKGASGGAFEVPSVLSPWSRRILLAHSFINDHRLTPPQMVDMAEDTLNQASALAGAGVPGTAGWWLPLSPTCHLLTFCLPHRLDCVTAGPACRAQRSAELVNLLSHHEMPAISQPGFLFS